MRRLAFWWVVSCVGMAACATAVSAPDEEPQPDATAADDASVPAPSDGGSQPDARDSSANRADTGTSEAGSDAAGDGSTADARSDAAGDAGSDAMSDASDAGSDVGTDAGVDAGRDATTDASPEGGANEAGADATTLDASRDAPPDAPTDAPQDALADAARDAAFDAAACPPQTSIYGENGITCSSPSECPCNATCGQIGSLVQTMCCMTAAQPCNVDNDCCGQLLCTNNVCQ